MQPKKHWNGFCDAVDNDLPLRQAVPASTPERLELYIVAGLRFSTQFIAAGDIEKHALTLMIVGQKRLDDNWRPRRQRVLTTRHSPLLNRLAEFECLADDAPDWQSFAAELYADALQQGGLESRWSLFAFMECVRRYIVTKSAAVDEIVALLEAFIRRLGASRRPLTIRPTIRPERLHRGSGPHTIRTHVVERHPVVRRHRSPLSQMRQ